MTPSLIVHIVWSDPTMVKVNQADSRDFPIFGEQVSPSDISVDDSCLMNIFVQIEDTESED